MRQGRGMNRFKKSKYIIVLFVVMLVVSVFLVTTQSSTVVTKAGDGISLIDRIVQKTIPMVRIYKVRFRKFDESLQ